MVSNAFVTYPVFTVESRGDPPPSKQVGRIPEVHFTKLLLLIFNMNKYIASFSVWLNRGARAIPDRSARLVHKI